MRLRTKLVLTATGVTFGIVLVLSFVFVGELLRQRVQQTSDSNHVLAQEVMLVTAQAVRTGLHAHPLALAPDAAGTGPDAALHEAVADSLRSSDALADLMNAIVSYSAPVQDVSVTDAQGNTIVSTDPDALNQRATDRINFAQVRDGSLLYQLRELFGRPSVLDVAAPLDRNGAPFLVVHVGVRSTFLRATYAPWLRTALWFALLATFASVAAAAILSTVALRPLVVIGEQLERLALERPDPLDPTQDSPASLPSGKSPLALEAPLRAERAERADPVGRVNRTIDRLGRQIRSREEGYIALQENLEQMLDNLRDGVLLFTADRRAIMVSDAVAHFVVAPSLHRADAPDAAPPRADALVGLPLEEIFPSDSALGTAVAAAFENGRNLSAQTVTLEDGRQVQISVDHIGEEPAARTGPRREMGILLTLRDTGSALQLEQELEVSRRLAAIGRLTANVGHEVKNPINAMVVHLELLRGKLAAGGPDARGAQRHVDILADEMHRLDRVVQTLADFSRPIELDLHEQDLGRVVGHVLELTSAELRQQSVRLEADLPATPLAVRVDGELIRQALLNLLLNAMQAMPSGGLLRVGVRRERNVALVEIADNGVGIPESVLPRIFDLYFTTKPKGSGIGLAMTYRILQLHGGALEVRSDADPASPFRGTIFTVRIPVAIAPSNDNRSGPALLAAAPLERAERDVGPVHHPVATAAIKESV